MKERSAGFTLLEVMVAVAVLGIAMAAGIKAGSQATANMRHLQDRTFAHWVGSNVLTELRARGFWREHGDDGTREMAGQAWYWTFRVEDTPNPDFRRVDVAVYREEGDAEPVATVTGMISNPALRHGAPPAAGRRRE